VAEGVRVGEALAKGERLGDGVAGSRVGVLVAVTKGALGEDEGATERVGSAVGVA
jgi:hypothetical protein